MNTHESDQQRSWSLEFKRAPNAIAGGVRRSTALEQKDRQSQGREQVGCVTSPAREAAFTNSILRRSASGSNAAGCCHPCRRTGERPVPARQTHVLDPLQQISFQRESTESP